MTSVPASTRGLFVHVRVSDKHATVKGVAVDLHVHPHRVALLHPRCRIGDLDNQLTDGPAVAESDANADRTGSLSLRVEAGCVKHGTKEEHGEQCS